MTPAELLSDAFDRILETATAAVDGLSDDALTTRPAADANPIGRLVWHLARVQDDHVAEVAGTEQVWTARGHAERFDLPFDEGWDPLVTLGVRLVSVVDDDTQHAGQAAYVRGLIR